MLLRYAKILLLILLSQAIFAQMQIDWQQCYCSMETDEAWDVVQVNDGYLVIGMQQGGDGQVICSNTSGAWLLRINGTGEIDWQKCYSEKSAYRMFNEFDGANIYVIGAAMMDPYPNETNLWVSKIDSTGNIIWERSLGNNDGVSSYIFYGNPTNDGGCVAIADIFSQGGDITNWYGGYDGWLVKLDSLGNTEWDFTVGSQNADAINGVKQTLDNGYIIAGYGRPDGISGNITNPSYTSSYADAVIYKLDSLGNPVWNKTYGGSNSDVAGRSLSLPDGYLIAGLARSNDGYLEGSGWHGESDIWLIRTDLNGEIIWNRCYGGSDTEGVSRVFSTSDGGFVIFGRTLSHDGDVTYNPAIGNSSSIWVFKVNSQGQLQWEQCIGGGQTENVYGVVQHSDLNYTLAGKMFYSPSGDVDCSNFIYGSGYNYWVLGISDTIVNINEPNQMIEKVKIYPNPTNSIINIDFPSGYKYKNTTIELISINGKTVLRSKLMSLSTRVDIKELNKGLYLVKIQNDNTIITKKIIIQ
jgi:hypothetical protein